MYINKIPFMFLQLHLSLCIKETLHRLKKCNWSGKIYALFLKKWINGHGIKDQLRWRRQGRAGTYSQY